MSKVKKENIEKKHKKYDKGQIFIKVMAGVLASLMLVATSASFIFALIG